MSLNTSHYSEPIKVTSAFFILYFSFLTFQSGSKFYLYFKQRGENKDGKVSFAKIKYGSTDKLAVTADRTVGNLVEQSIPFLAALWMHAVFVSPSSAAAYGWAYLLCRAFYPIVFYLGVPYLFISTIPGYVIIVRLVWACYAAVQQ